MIIASNCDQARAVDPHWSSQPKIVHGYMPVRASHPRLHLLQKFIEPVRIIAWVIFCQSGKVSHRAYCKCDSSYSNVKLGVMIVKAPLSLSLSVQLA